MKLVIECEVGPLVQSFGVTYEGLKRLLFLCAYNSYSGFGVTYEGLKLPTDHGGAGASEGFGVTYEGLKHPRVVCSA